MLSQSCASCGGETKLPGVVRSGRPQEQRAPCHIEQVVMTNQRVWLRLQKLGTTRGDDSPAIHQGAGIPQRSLGTCGGSLQTARSRLEGALPFGDLGELGSQRSQGGVGSRGPSLGRDSSWKGYTPPSATTGPSTQPPPSCCSGAWQGSRSSCGSRQGGGRGCGGSAAQRAAVSRGSSGRAAQKARDRPAAAPAEASSAKPRPCGGADAEAR